MNTRSKHPKKNCFLSKISILLPSLFNSYKHSIDMTLQHTKCTIFFVIGCLALSSLIGCTSNNNKASKIELSAASETIISVEKPQDQYMIEMEIDDSALAELDLWTAFFVLQKEVLKLEENKPNAFQGDERNIEVYFKNLKLNIPETFDTNPIWARLKVLETGVYLYSEYSNTKATPERTTTARNTVLIAYYNLVRQINKTHEKQTQIIKE